MLSNNKTSPNHSYAPFHDMEYSVKVVGWRLASEVVGLKVSTRCDDTWYASLYSQGYETNFRLSKTTCLFASVCFISLFFYTGVIPNCYTKSVTLREVLILKCLFIGSPQVTLSGFSVTLKRFFLAFLFHQLACMGSRR